MFNCCPTPFEKKRTIDCFGYPVCDSFFCQPAVGRNRDMDTIVVNGFGQVCFQSMPKPYSSLASLEVSNEQASSDGHAQTQRQIIRSTCAKSSDQPVPNHQIELEAPDHSRHNSPLLNRTGCAYQKRRPWEMGDSATQVLACMTVSRLPRDKR